MRQRLVWLSVLAAMLLTSGAVLADNPDDIYWDNSISASFAGVGGEVSAAIVYDGKLVIGGGFRVAGDQLVNYIAMWDGSRWSSLASGMNGGIQALAVFDGKLIAGGQFTIAGGTEVNNIASWDGTTWSPLGSGAEIRIEALTLFNGKLVAAGLISIIGYPEAITVASWDGISWSPLAITNGSVKALAVYDGKLIVGGKFTEIDGAAAKRIACWDGSSWTPFGFGMEGSNVPYISSLAVYDEQLIAGGYFHTAGGMAARNIAMWNGAAWSPMDSGADGYVEALYVYDGNLVAGGYFYRAGGNWVSGIASWNGSTWSAIGSGLGGQALALTEYDGKLISGGAFFMAGESPATCIAAWDGSEWSAMGIGINLFVKATTMFDGKLIVGGSFASIADIHANRIASWNGNNWEALGSGMSNEPGWSDNVEALTMYEENLITGGTFYYAGGIPVNRVASWNGSSWSPMGEGPGGPVRALVVLDGVLYAGGGDNVSSWDGASWTQLGGDFDGSVRAITKYDGRLIAGGWFKYVDGVEVNCIASWDGTTWLPLGSGLTGSGDGTKVSCLAVYDGLLIAGGQFRLAGDVLADDLACWDGSTWSPMGEWKGTNSVNALIVYNGKLIVGGSFYADYGSPGNYIAAWNGTTWSTFGSGVDGAVQSLTPYKDKLVVGGNFRIAGNKVAGHLAMWTKPNSITVELDIKPGSCPNTVNLKNPSAHSKGVVPAAILGTANFDVRDIDPATLTLEGVQPLRWSYDDVATPAEEDDLECSCSDDGPDGFEDLVLKFRRSALVYQLSPLPSPGSELTLTLAGKIMDGPPIEGSDCIRIPGKHKLQPLAYNISPPGSSTIELLGNFPNPFNPVTEIRFSLPEATEVNLEIFNVLGQLVTTVASGKLDAGFHSVKWNASAVGSGLYFYRLRAGEFVETKTLLLLK